MRVRLWVDAMGPKYPVCQAGKAGMGRVGCFLAGMALVFLALMPLEAAAATRKKGLEIMQAVYGRNMGKAQTADLKMTLIDKEKNLTVLRLQSLRRDFYRNRKTLFVIQTPENLKNSRFLIHDYTVESSKDGMWLFLPAVGKIRKIAKEEKADRFLGSDFSYSDLIRPKLAHYEFRLLKEPKLNLVPTWQVQALPKSDKIAKEAGASRSMLWVRKDNFVVVRAIHWLYENRRLKYMQVTQLDLIGGVWVATEIQMVTKQGSAVEHATILQYRNIKFNQRLRGQMFSTQVLRKGSG